MAPVKKKIIRGFARTEKDEARLLACGVPDKAIYRAYRDQPFETVMLKSGDELHVVDGFRAISSGRTAIVAAYKRVHDMGATIVDAETKQNSREHGVEMLDEALKPKKPSAEHMRMMQAKAAELKRQERISESAAQKFWRNSKLSVQEALELMTGWTQSAAYKVFGPRNFGAGRRRESLRT
jgi:hypothetical protein